MNKHEHLTRPVIVIDQTVDDIFNGPGNFNAIVTGEQIVYIKGKFTAQELTDIANEATHAFT